MREVIARQLRLGHADIGRLTFNPRSRDDIPQVLQGLQYIYVTDELREAVFAVLEKRVPAEVDASRGRPGMDLWNALVLATLRVNLNWDYDRLLEMANQHRSIRQMLGHGFWDDDDEYKLQTVKDNAALVDEASLQRINQLVVEAGHKLLKKKAAPLSARCDSFVVESNIHYPTDINLLYDAVRCSVRTVADWCEGHGDSRWRQWQYNLRQVKKACRHAQKLKHSSSQDPDKQATRQQAIRDAHHTYLGLCAALLSKVEETVADLPLSLLDSRSGNDLQRWLGYGWHQVDLVRRRVLDGETIPHGDKIFSLFEDYSEWLSKGKAGVPVELGLNVCVMESADGFILHHQVMQHCPDSEIAVTMVKQAKALFPSLSACSFDKGFHSPANQRELAELLDRVVLPKKGRWSQADTARETDPAFVQARRQHSAVESGINALEVHGLDYCPDRGLERFKRYVALAVVGRNLQKVGAILQARALEALQKDERRRQRQAA